MNLQTEFPQLNNHIYLDNSGSPPVPQSLLKDFVEKTSHNLFGNPHSLGSPSSQETSEWIQAIRHRVLAYLNTNSNEYQVIFTNNATGAIKKVGECLSWERGRLFYLQESHTSILGMRELVYSACQDWSKVQGWTVDQVQSFLLSNDSLENDFNLFCFPAQCNFSGTRFPLDWIHSFKQKSSSWKILVDAASYSMSMPFDLSLYPADFLVLSFYKIFGYPTGLGALIVRKETLHLLNPSYFGGGTVNAVDWSGSWVSRIQNDPQRLEDGTLPFLEIISLDSGFDFIQRIGGWDRVHDSILELTHIMRHEMTMLKTRNPDIPLCKIYSDSRFDTGPIITFNIRDSNGSWISFAQVQQLASLHNFHIRVGCFCNPGACSKALGVSVEEMKHLVQNLGFSCSNYEHSMIHGKPLGAIRVSLGLCNTKEHVYKWISFLDSHFGQCKPENFQSEQPKLEPCVPLEPIISNLVIYPIKSCGGFQVQEWPFKNSGFLVDRYWKLVDDQGQTLTQKRFPKLALIRPIRIDLINSLIEYSCPDYASILLNFSLTNQPQANEWFSTYLGIPCRLHSDESSSFANESPFLLVSESSFIELKETICTQEIYISCFRANIIVSNLKPFIEESWTSEKLEFDNLEFKVSGRCKRCGVSCVNQETGIRSSEPLSTLFRNKATNDKHAFFGLHISSLLKTENEVGKLKIGQTLLLKQKD